MLNAALLLVGDGREISKRDVLFKLANIFLGKIYLGDVRTNGSFTSIVHFNNIRNDI